MPPSASGQVPGGHEGLLLGSGLSTTNGPGRGGEGVGTAQLSPSPHLSQTKHPPHGRSERIRQDGQHRARQSLVLGVHLACPSTTTEQRKPQSSATPATQWIQVSLLREDFCSDVFRVQCMSPGPCRGTALSLLSTATKPHPPPLPTAPFPMGLRATVLP